MKKALFFAGLLATTASLSLKGSADVPAPQVPQVLVDQVAEAIRVAVEQQENSNIAVEVPAAAPAQEALAPVVNPVAEAVVEEQVAAPAQEVPVPVAVPAQQALEPLVVEEMADRLAPMRGEVVIEPEQEAVPVQELPALDADVPADVPADAPAGGNVDANVVTLWQQLGNLIPCDCLRACMGGRTKTAAVLTASAAIVAGTYCWYTQQCQKEEQQKRQHCNDCTLIGYSSLT